MTRRINLQHKVLQSSGVLVSDMDGDKVAMSIQSGKYYNLGPVGGRIWELISAPASLHEVVDVLVSEYEVERSVCEEQVVDFVSKLTEESLVELVKEPSA